MRLHHLGSHVLGELARRVGADWQQRWGYRPLLMETFVDPVRFRGTCYQAAGWIELGRTTGRGLARVEDYITDVVARMLARQPTQSRHVDIFREAAFDRRFEEVNLFSLNHDCLIANFLLSKDIAVIDGFDNENELGIRKWNPALFDCYAAHATTSAVRLFKLHGSIDWRRFRPGNDQCDDQASNPWCDEYLGIRSNPALGNAKDEKGRPHKELGRARFLAGTFNKMLDMATLTIQLPPQRAQTEFNLRRWSELLADPDLAKVEGRVETDRYGHVIMSPRPATRHGRFQARIAILLDRCLDGGEVLTECPISTADGVRPADVAWASADRIRELGNHVCFLRSPEICVEVLSPGNTEAEIREKIALDFDAGALEVWICSDSGAMRFFHHGETEPKPASQLCPGCPRQIELRPV